MALFRSLALGAGLLLALAAAPAHAQDPVIAAGGDIACDPNGGNFNSGNGTTNFCRQKYTSDQLVTMAPDAVLTLGDTQYEQGTLAQFQGSYDPSWGRVKSVTRPVIGNHEYQQPDAANPPAKGYFDYFNGVGVADGPAGERDKGYYSFNVGNWHLIALNSMCVRVGGCGAGSAQEQWLRGDLAANSTAACTIAYWHHPLFNSGPDGNYNDDPQNNTIALWQALFEAGADVAVTSHSHTYQRFGPQDAAAVANALGLREFIVGTGGASLGTFGPTQPNLDTRDNTKFGVLRLVLKASGYDWSFVSETGATSDPGSGTCHGAPADATQPETSISSGPDGLTPSRDAGFAFASSETPASFRCRFDGPGAAIGTDAPCNSPRAFTGLPDGAYTFTVYARDSTGNIDASPATRSFTVDTAPPETSITAGPSGTISTTSASFSLAASEGGSTFECSLDGGAFAACASPVTYDGLAEGQHTFGTRATDPAGNTDVTPEGRTFVVDVPVAPATPAENEPPSFTPLPDPLGPLTHLRVVEREIVSGRAFRGRGGKRRLNVDDGERLEIAAAEKRSGRFVSEFYALFAVDADLRDSLRSLVLTYNGGTSARNATATLYVFNYRTRRWVKLFSREGRRDRGFDWEPSAFAADFVSRKGSVSVRVKGKRAKAFRTRTDLLELIVAS